MRQCRVGKLKFDPSEHGLIKRKPNPSTKAMEEDPEIESDAEFSDVDEGIIYPNKVLTLMGKVLIPPPAPDPDPDSLVPARVLLSPSNDSETKYQQHRNTSLSHFKSLDYMTPE